MGRTVKQKRTSTAVPQLSLCLICKMPPGLSTYHVWVHGADTCRAIRLRTNVAVIMNCKAAKCFLYHIQDSFHDEMAHIHSEINTTSGQISYARRVMEFACDDVLCQDFCIFTEACPNLRLSYKEAADAVYTIEANVVVKDDVKYLRLSDIIAKYVKTNFKVFIVTACRSPCRPPLHSQGFTISAWENWRKYIFEPAQLVNKPPTPMRPITNTMRTTTVTNTMRPPPTTIRPVTNTMPFTPSAAGQSAWPPPSPIQGLSDKLVNKPLTPMRPITNTMRTTTVTTPKRPVATPVRPVITNTMNFTPSAVGQSAWPPPAPPQGPSDKSLDSFLQIVKSESVKAHGRVKTFLKFVHTALVGEVMKQTQDPSITTFTILTSLERRLSGFGLGNIVDENNEPIARDSGVRHVLQELSNRLVALRVEKGKGKGTPAKPTNRRHNRF